MKTHLQLPESFEVGDLVMIDGNITSGAPDYLIDHWTDRSDLLWVVFSVDFSVERLSAISGNQIKVVPFKFFKIVKKRTVRTDKMLDLIGFNK